VCARRLTGEGIFEKTPSPAVCQRIRADSDRKKLAEGGLRDSKTGLPELCLQMSWTTWGWSRHSREERNSTLLKKVNGVQRFEPCQTPEEEMEEMAGELQHATGV
ncbi:hypothetical protein M9458_056473, partial [Cirrhinus mrigala]